MQRSEDAMAFCAPDLHRGNSPRLGSYGVWPYVFFHGPFGFDLSVSGAALCHALLETFRGS
jgi:hypothetical protein